MGAPPAVWAVALWLLAAAGGCGEDGDEAASREQGSATVGGDVVSTVDGHPITAEEVRHVAVEVDLGPPEALERLQERELLAAEARRLGYAADPDVLRTTKQALVQALLEREVEHAVGPESITDEAIAARYETRAERAQQHGITLEDARDEIREQLLIEAREERLEQLLRELEERWEVRRDEAAIDRLVHAEAAREEGT